MKEDQAFSLSLELGRREKVARHPFADFLLHFIGGGWWFCRYCYAFKGIVSRDSIFFKFCEATSVHSCVRWCFALKGQCHKIFCFIFFSWIIFPQASENPQICGLTKLVTFADLPHVRQFAKLQFADPIFFAICGFAVCWPKFIAELQLPQIWKFLIFLLTNT